MATWRKTVNTKRQTLKRLGEVCLNELQDLKNSINPPSYKKERTKKRFHSYYKSWEEIVALEDQLASEIIPNALQSFADAEKHLIQTATSCLKDFSSLKRQNLGSGLSKEFSSYKVESVKTTSYGLPCYPEDIMSGDYDSQANNKKKSNQKSKKKGSAGKNATLNESSTLAARLLSPGTSKPELPTRKNPKQSSAPNLPTRQQRSPGTAPSLPNRAPREKPPPLPNKKTTMPFPNKKITQMPGSKSLMGTFTSKKTSAPIGISSSGSEMDKVSAYFGNSLDATRKPPSQEEKEIFEYLETIGKCDESRMTEQQKKENKRLRNRTKLAREIYETEKSFVKSLNRIVQFFLFPLQESAKGEGVIIAQDDIVVIFSNVGTIRKLNTKFLGSIKDRLRSWKRRDCLGDLFNDFTPYFKMYTSYVNNHEYATVKLKQLQKNSKVQDFLAEAQKQCGPTLDSLLIAPIQRIPRYKLLLDEFLKNTPSNHPDHSPLQEALAKVKKVAMTINEAVRDRENRDIVRDLETEFVGGESFITPSRRFVRRGELVKKGTQMNQTYDFILFNDMLVYARRIPGIGKLKLHRAIDIDQAFQINTNFVGQEEGKLCFQLITSQKSFIVYAKTLEDFGDWIENLRSCLKEQKKKIGSDTTTAVSKPIFDNDQSSDGCKICGEKFKLTFRRHHCRKCGLLVCSRCSRRRMKLPGSKGVERVCDQCVDRYRVRRGTSVKPPTPSARNVPPVPKRDLGFSSAPASVSVASQLQSSSSTRGMPPPAKYNTSSRATPQRFEESEESSDSDEVEVIADEGDEGDWEEPAPGEDGSRADQYGPLPDGWILYYTEDKDIPYYFNEDTNETVWRRPT